MIFALVYYNNNETSIGYKLTMKTRATSNNIILQFLPTADSDFMQLLPISFTNEADIRLFTTYDLSTLEYDDYVILTFTPSNPFIIPALEGEGEYVRTSAIVNIIDNDRK